MTHPAPEPSPGLVPPASPARKPSLVWPGIIAAALIAIAAGAYYYFQSSRQNAARQAAFSGIRTATVRRGTLDIRLRMTGTTTAQDYAAIVAPRLRGPEAGAMVILKLINSGDMVKKGDLLVEFDPQSMKDHLDDTIDGLRDKQNDIQKRKVNNELQMEILQQSLRQAKAAVDKARLDYKALEVRTDIDRELLGLSLEEAEAAYKEMLADVGLTRQSLAADLRNAEIGTKVEELHVGRHEGDLKMLAIRAPMDGMVVLQTMFRPGGDQVTLAVGDTMRPGQPVMKVINPQKMMVEGTVNQAEVTRLRIGHEATVGLDAFPGADYRGKVYSIGAIAVGSRRENYYIRNIPVRIQVENADRRMIPDLSASADILTAREDAVALVPAAAVESENGKSFVSVRTSKGFVKREVKTGASDGVHTAVLEGLTEGEVVRTN